MQEKVMIADSTMMMDGQSRRFPCQKTFEMLLNARRGVFEDGIPIRSSASPIDTTIQSQCFYVSTSFKNVKKPVNKAKTEEAAEICVKYNNCARSRVWWSPDYNECLGMVSRKMGMRPRISSPNAVEKGRHGFEGHWLALVERSSPGKITDKRVIRNYILDTAPSIVQFWAAEPRGNKTERAVQKITSQLHTSQPPGNLSKVVKSEKQFAQDMGLDANSLILGSNSNGKPSPPPIETKLIDAEIMQNPEQQRMHEDSIAVQKDAFQKTVNTRDYEMEDSEFYKPKRSRRNSTKYDELTYLLNALNDNNTKSDIQDPNENDDNKSDIEESSYDALVLAYDIFRSCCETFTPEEFKRWYDMYANTLFLPNVAQGLKYYIEMQDPRLRPDFMFSQTCAFLEGEPVRSMEYIGSFARGFRLYTAEEETMKFLELDHFDNSRNDVYEEIMESKMMLLTQHLFFKQLVSSGDLDLKDYWFHIIVKLPSGKRMVLRGHSVVVGNYGDIEQELRHLGVQDVSDAYKSILDLPPLPC